MDADALRPTLRALLENDIRTLAQEGHIADRGEREVRLRIDTDGNLRWFEVTRVKVPASELDRHASAR